VTGYDPQHRARRARLLHQRRTQAASEARQPRDWFGYARVGARTAVVVPRPGQDQVVIAIVGDDGARASTVVSRATLAQDGIMPGLLAQLDATQAEVRARKEAG
jgi:hypothetical protein